MNRLKNYLESIRFHFFALFRWYRVLGIAATACVFYALVFVVLARTDVSWLLPKSASARVAWPDLPRFFISRETTFSGQEETLYTVPSRQLTPQEMARLGATNRTSAAPAPR